MSKRSIARGIRFRDDGHGLKSFTAMVDVCARHGLTKLSVLSYN